MISDNFNTTPKVLIIGQPFNDNTGGGITLTHLFHRWSSESLAVACSGYLIDSHTDFEICNKYYQLGEKENQTFFPFSVMKRKYHSGPIVPLEGKNDSRHIVEHIPKQNLRLKLINELFVPLLENTGLGHVIFKTTLSNEFRSWINTFDPDIIYAQTSSLDGLKFCLAVKEYVQKPMIFHVMDDWPLLLTNRGWFQSYWSRKVDFAFRKLIANSDLLLSISESMSQEYLLRYGEEFIPFHNPIDLLFWKKQQRQNYSLSKNPVILYAGRTGLGIDKSLITTAHAIEKVNSELGEGIQFVIQTSATPTWIDTFDCVHHSPFVPYVDLPRVFATADILLLPYDFSDDAINFIRYSMPTKASEFMASGTPILVFAPAETALVEYAKKYGWAQVVTSNTEGDLAKIVKHLIEDKTLREKIANRAKAIAEERHDLAKVSSEFQQLLMRVSSDQKIEAEV